MALQSLRSSPATSALASSSSTVLKDLTECVHNSSSMDNKLLPGVELGVKRPAEDEPGETNQQVPLCEKSKDPLSYSGVSTKFKVARQQQSSFNSPMTSQTTHNTTAPSAVQCSDDDRPASHYYNVVWCVTITFLSVCLSAWHLLFALCSPGASYPRKSTKHGREMVCEKR